MYPALFCDPFRKALDKHRKIYGKASWKYSILEVTLMIFAERVKSSLLSLIKKTASPLGCFLKNRMLIFREAESWTLYRLFYSSYLWKAAVWKKKYWIIFIFPLKHLLLRLLASKEASCSQKHSLFVWWIYHYCKEITLFKKFAINDIALGTVHIFSISFFPFQICCE